MNFDHELKQVLKRRQPPPGFTARVMARVDATPKVRSFPTPRWMPWAVAAALLLSSTGGGIWEHQRLQHARAEKARDQILLALHVTGVKLDQVRAQVRSIRNQE